MPYKTGKLKGELTAPELRRLIKEHNKLMSIKIPPKTDRDGLLKLIEDNKYKVNHEQQKLVPVVQMKRKPTIKLPPAPTPKTAEEKADAKKQKDKKKLEDNLKLKMKVEKVKSKVSDSEMKAKKSEPTKEKPPPINKATPPPIKKATPPPLKSDSIDELLKNYKFSTPTQKTKFGYIYKALKDKKEFQGYIGNTIKFKINGNKITFTYDFLDRLGVRGVQDAILKNEKSVFNLKPMNETKQIDEELWTEFKELVEENKDKLLNIIRPEDKKLKNQYDYYISKYNDRKKPDSLPAKKMMALLKRKLK